MGRGPKERVKADALDLQMQGIRGHKEQGKLEHDSAALMEESEHIDVQRRVAELAKEAAAKQLMERQIRWRRRRSSS